MVRRAIVVIAVAATPASLLTMMAADAGAGSRVLPPTSGDRAAHAVAQADVTRKARPAAATTTSLRGKGSRANDTATPPSPETAPAMSASPRPGRTIGAAHALASATSKARAPPA
jgi:hypothetical protein